MKTGLMTPGPVTEYGGQAGDLYRHGGVFRRQTESLGEGKPTAAHGNDAIEPGLTTLSAWLRK